MNLKAQIYVCVDFDQEVLAENLNLDFWILLRLTGGDKKVSCDASYSVGGENHFASTQMLQSCFFECHKKANRPRVGRKNEIFCSARDKMCPTHIAPEIFCNILPCQRCVPHTKLLKMHLRSLDMASGGRNRMKQWRCIYSWGWVDGTPIKSTAQYNGCRLQRG